MEFIIKRMSDEHIEQIASLEKGTYTFNYRVAIARGGVDFEHFEFTV